MLLAAGKLLVPEQIDNAHIHDALPRMMSCQTAVLTLLSFSAHSERPMPRDGDDAAIGKGATQREEPALQKCRAPRALCS